MPRNKVELESKIVYLCLQLTVRLHMYGRGHVVVVNVAEVTSIHVHSV
jgi:hypothetical protein